MLSFEHEKSFLNSEPDVHSRKAITIIVVYSEKTAKRVQIGKVITFTLTSRQSHLLARNVIKFESVHFTS